MNPKAAALARKILRTVCLVLPMYAIYSDAWMVDRAMVPNRSRLHSTEIRSSSCLILPIFLCAAHNGNVRHCSSRLHSSSSENASTEESSNNSSNSSNNHVKMSELNDMDVVIFSILDDDENDKLCLGAVQEGGVLSPLSAWTDEPAFGDSIEFLVDEVDRFSLKKQTEDQLQIDANKNNDSNNDANHTIRIHHWLTEDEVSYGARQCPRGVHNPHGEESELLYYIDQRLIDEFQIRMNLKPELETLW